MPCLFLKSTLHLAANEQENVTEHLGSFCLIFLCKADGGFLFSEESSNSEHQGNETFLQCQTNIKVTRYVTLCQSPGINNGHTVCSSHDKSSELQFDMFVFCFF